jgi:hypothetical protein
MSAFTKAAEMKNHMKYIQSGGYEVRMMQDGTLEVQDPYCGYNSGKYGVDGHDVVVLRNARAAEKFIRDRS